VNYLGTLDQEGGTLNVTGGLNLPSFFIGPGPGFFVSGYFTLHGGNFSAASIDLNGTITQTGGTNLLAGDLTVNFFPASYSLSGGLLAASNTLIGFSSAWVPFTQSGGTHAVQNLLRVTSASGYNLTGGELIAPNIDIGGSLFTHVAGTVSNSDVITLDSSEWFEQTPNQQFGSLQLSGGAASVLSLAAGPSTVHFADSSSQAWSNTATLQIDNWAGSLNGGGQSQLIFGNNSGGLTAGQLAQIQFQYPQGIYPAKILSSGEVVPDATGTPFYPTDLSARALSSNQISVLWTDNAINATSYGIERSLDGSNFVQVATASANATNYSDTGLTADTHYYYRIRSLGTDGNSDYSGIALATTKLSTPPPVADMIAWWRGEGTPEDAIGQHDGSIWAGVTYPTGKVGQAFDFPGLGQRVVIPDSPDFVLTNAFSIEGWIYPRQLSTGFVTLRGDARGGLDTWTVHMEHIPGYLSFQIDGETNDYAEINAPVQINQWQHFAATFDATNGLKLYINGVLTAQTNTTVRPVGILDPTGEPSIGIGNSGVSSDDFSFDGMIDELALYSRALTPQEIQRIYNSGAAGKLQLPQTMALARQSNGTMQLNFAGFASRSYEFDISTNLVNWIPWTTQVNSGETISIMDTDATNCPARFYRAILLP
ncbi:MAG TPA: LamG-like jellyroll fold domain-containing protein, partial [Verrucomicrobiae bacterium]|nr:LamG-like jellyroll fold domain-containing protein [Verrucomicrobiae bacterium]